MPQGPICHKSVVCHVMPQGLICHKSVVCHALCDTIPICHSRELFMQKVLCVTVMLSLVTICHEVQYVICHMVMVWVKVRVRIPVETYSTLCIDGIWHNRPCDPVGSLLWHREHGAYQYCDIMGMLHLGPYPCHHQCHQHLPLWIEPKVNLSFP